MREPRPPYLVLGARGMLGRAWVELLRARGIEHETRVRPALELTDQASIERAIASGYGAVINCGAWTDVDGAEKHEDAATLVNGTGVGWLAARCREVGAVLVHFSTDYVFDGRGSVPFAVDRPLAPVNAYGRSKAAGEVALRESGAAHLLVRTSTLYAPWGENFVRKIARLARARDILRVVDDQVSRPSSSEYLATRTLALVEHGARGTFHVTDGGACSRFELAQATVAGLGLTCRVEPCTTAEFPAPAQRPAYSVLSLDETEHLLGPSTDWRENVKSVVARLEP